LQINTDEARFGHCSLIASAVAQCDEFFSMASSMCRCKIEMVALPLCHTDGASFDLRARVIVVGWLTSSVVVNMV
jgi:hypothetical protein